jgi:hypothetical protein
MEINFFLQHWSKNFATTFYQTTRCHALQQTSRHVDRSEELNVMQSCYVHLLQLKILCVQVETRNGCTPDGTWTLHVAITRSPNKDVPNWDTFLTKQPQSWRSLTAADLNKDLAHFPLSSKTWSARQNCCGCRKASWMAKGPVHSVTRVLFIELTNPSGIKTGSVPILTLMEVLDNEASRFKKFQRLTLTVRCWLTWTMVAGLESHWLSAVV